MKHLRHTLQTLFLVFTSVVFAATANAGFSLIGEDFDAMTAGQPPVGWPAPSQPADTWVRVTADKYASSPHSLQLHDGSTETGGAAYPAVSMPLPVTISAGRVTVSMDVLITIASGTPDPLYVKLRNSNNQELGGLRMYNGVFGHMHANGNFVASTIPYTPDTWYTLRIEYDLAAQTYSAWVDDAVVIEDTDFRSTATLSNAANLLLQCGLNVKASQSDAYIDDIIISISEGPEITQHPVSRTITEGESAHFSVAATGAAPLSCQWQKDGVDLADDARITGATTAALTIADALPSDAGDYTVTVTNSYGSITSTPATLTIDDAVTAPSITTQPAGQTITEGQTANFSVTAEGTAPLSYQWQKDGVDLADDARITGATTAALTIADALPSDAGDYTVTVTNSYGSITSATATLTIDAALTAPTITTQPVGQTVTEGQTASFTVTAEGTAPLLYQWQKNGADLTDDARITGATTAALTIYGALASDADSYTVTITNTVGSATSAAIMLSVRTGGDYTLIGEDFDAMTAGQPPVGWPAPSQPADTWVRVTADKYASSPHSLQLHDGSTETGGAAYPAVSMPLPVTISAGRVTVSMDVLITIASGTPDPLYVKLRNSNNQELGGLRMYNGVFGHMHANGNFVASTIPYTPDTWYTLRIEYDLAAQTYSAWVDDAVVIEDTDFRSTATLSNAANLLLQCGLNVRASQSDAYIDNIVLTTSAGPSITTQPSAQAVTEGETASFTVAADGAATLRYQWKKDGVDLTDDARITGATTAMLNITGVLSTDAGGYSVTVTNDIGGVTSLSATLAVNAAVAPTITTQPAGQTLIEGQTASFTVTAEGTATLRYQWKKDGVDLTNDARITGATAATLTILGALLSDAGSYTIVVANDHGDDTSDPASLVVNPAVNIPQPPVSIDADETGVTSFTARWNATAFATGYILDVSTDPNFGDFLPGYENLGIGPDTSFQVTGLAEDTTYYYRLRASNSAGASAPSNTITVTTRRSDAPVITSAEAATFTAGVACSFTITANGMPRPDISATGLPDWASFDAATGVLSGTAPEGASGDFAIAISARNGTSPDATQSFTLTVKPPPVIIDSLLVSTLAGTAGAHGNTDATGAAARFDAPTAVAVDSSGNIFIADALNDAIRKITADGTVTTLAVQAGGAPLFDTPMGIAVDDTGNLYVADTLNNIIRHVDASGAITTIAGQSGQSGGADGIGGDATFNAPQALALAPDASTLYVADTSNHAIRKIDLETLEVTTLAGQIGRAGSADATGTAASFNTPAGIAHGPGDTLYIADMQNHAIRIIAANTGEVRTLAGLAINAAAIDGAGGEARFNLPASLIADNTNSILYVLDTGNHSVRQIVLGGNDAEVLSLAGQAGTPGNTDGDARTARFKQPSGIALDPLGDLVIADTGNHTIRLGKFPETPEILAHPKSQSINAGDTVSFSVAAIGRRGLSYQWQHNTVPIPGATDSTYTITNAQSSHAGDYTVLVSNGQTSMTSNKATLSVYLVESPQSPAKGGGGAPSIWAISALALLCIARRLCRSGQRMS